MSCQHREDVCQHCLEKVQTTTEDSPPPKDTLPLVSKIILMPVVSSFLAASGVLWVISTKMLYKSAKIALKLVATTTE